MLEERERDDYVRHPLAQDDYQPLPDPPKSTGSGFLLALWYIFVVCVIMFGLVKFVQWAWFF